MPPKAQKSKPSSSLPVKGIDGSKVYPIDFAYIDQCIEKTKPKDEHWPVYHSPEGLRNKWKHTLETGHVHNVPVIFDDDRFRSHFYDPTGVSSSAFENETESPLSLTSPPPLKPFKQVYEVFKKGKMHFMETSPITSNSNIPREFGSEDARLRLFTFAHGLKKPHKPLWPPNEKVTQAKIEAFIHHALWPHYCNEIHPTYHTHNWLEIYRRSAQNNKTDEHFEPALFAYEYFYPRVAPVIDLWLWEARLELARRAIRDAFVNENGTSFSFDHSRSRQEFIPPRLIVQQCSMWIQRLNQELCSPLEENDIEALKEAESQASNSGDLFSFVHAIARSQHIRSVARLLPNRPVSLLAYLIEQVLDRHKFEEPYERSSVIELLRDVVALSTIPLELKEEFSLTDFRPRSMQYDKASGKDVPVNVDEVTQGVNNLMLTHSDVKDGSDGRVIFGTIAKGGVRVEVVLREPKREQAQTFGADQYVFDRRYKRTLVQQRWLSHRNLLDVMGWCMVRNEHLPAVVLPQMKCSLRDHEIQDPRQYFHLMRGVLEGLTYLRANNVVHSDLHWQNVLISPDGDAIIADFGLSRLIVTRVEHLRDAVASNTTPPLPSAYPLFMPPEFRTQAHPDLRPDHTTDTYCFGILLLACALPTFPATPSSEKETFAREVELWTGLTENNKPVSEVSGPIAMRDEYANISSSTSGYALQKAANAWEADRQALAGQSSNGPSKKRKERQPSAEEPPLKSSRSETSSTPHQGSNPTPRRSSRHAKAVQYGDTDDTESHMDIDPLPSSAPQPAPTFSDPASSKTGRAPASSAPPSAPRESLETDGQTAVEDDESYVRFPSFNEDQQTKLWDLIRSLAALKPNERPEKMSTVAAGFSGVVGLAGPGAMSTEE